MLNQNQSEVIVNKAEYCGKEILILTINNFNYLPQKDAEKFAPLHSISNSLVTLKDAMGVSSIPSAIESLSGNSLVIETTELARIAIKYNHSRLTKELTFLAPFLPEGGEFFSLDYPGYTVTFASA